MKYSLQKFKTYRAQLIKQFTTNQCMRSFPEENTALTDQYFQDSFQESQAGTALQQQKIPFACVALGGYGRRELCLHSDIDILILFRKKVPIEVRELVQEIFFPLWDLGFELGYGTRTIKECLSLVKDDFEVLASMMDARFICGEYPLYLDLIEKLHEKVLSKKGYVFGHWLAERYRMRLDRFGDSSFLLEPNLKESIGGLRDYHHMLWLARAFFGLREPRDLMFLAVLSYREYHDLRQHVGFLWNVRNQLHYLSGRKNDRLRFEYQEKIAVRLGFLNQEASLAVEQFISRLHATMAAIKFLTRSFTAGRLPTKKSNHDRVQTVNIDPGLILEKGELGFRSAGDILSNPSLLMAIFQHSAHFGFPLSLEAKRLVRELSYLVDDHFRESDRIAKSFLKIVTESEHTFETLDQMLEIGFLGTFIPEFGKVKDRVEFDAYHIYPVGMHSLQTVRYLKGLINEKDILQRDLWGELLHPERLLLAGLFHDIGKIGKEHASKGTEITRNILKRFAFTEDVIEDICFLVCHHLLLVKTATRRDLSDEKVVVYCARLINETERLKMLYLLTWADSRATGPKAWNEWIATLVQELFFKVLHILERGELATHDASRKLEQVKSTVRQQVGSTVNEEDLEACFDIMSPRYLLNTPSREIVRHLSMADRLRAGLRANDAQDKEKSKEEIFIFETRRDEAGDCWEITFLARDRPGLFSIIAGVLTLNNINILSAEIYTWHNGTAVDVLRTTNPLDNLFVQEKWTKIQEDLKEALTGRLSLEFRLREKAGSSFLTAQKKPSRPPEVIMDNKSSDFFTLIEVFADDHIGLLYRITHTLFTLGLDIHIAKISTKVDQVADVFYVRDLEGQKVEDEGRVEEIKTGILDQLKHL